jgi:hypothetical protein
MPSDLKDAHIIKHLIEKGNLQIPCEYIDEATKIFEEKINSEAGDFLKGLEENFYIEHFAIMRTKANYIMLVHGKNTI